MDTLFSKILSNGKNVTGEAPGVDTQTVTEVKEDIKSKLPVDDQGNHKPRRRRTLAELGAARREVPAAPVKVICEHNDVPDMPVGAGVVRPGIQIKESYPMVARLLENNAEFVILYKRILTMKSVFCQDQWSKEELKYMNERFKDGGVL